jgi:hypothetical protein
LRANLERQEVNKFLFQLLESKLRGKSPFEMCHCESKENIPENGNKDLKKLGYHYSFVMGTLSEAYGTLMQNSVHLSPISLLGQNATFSKEDSMPWRFTDIFLGSNSMMPG